MGKSPKLNYEDVPDGSGTFYSAADPNINVQFIQVEKYQGQTTIDIITSKEQ